MAFSTASAPRAQDRDDAAKGAVKQQIEDQRKLVEWWDTVVPRPGGDRQSEKHCPRSGTMLSETEVLNHIHNGTPLPSEEGK
jgi:hypothetical protein